MIITINTDASFHPVHKVAAFSCWIVCNQGRMLHSGALKKAKDPNDAEMQGIANALHMVLQSKFVRVTKIIINNDNKYSHQQITTGKSKCSMSAKASARSVRQLIKSIGEKYSLDPNWRRWIEFRYVPAHKGTETARSWVNDWCDNAAKEQMRKQIK